MPNMNFFPTLLIRVGNKQSTNKVFKLYYDGLKTGGKRALLMSRSFSLPVNNRDLEKIWIYIRKDLDTYNKYNNLPKAPIGQKMGVDSKEHPIRNITGDATLVWSLGSSNIGLSLYIGDVRIGHFKAQPLHRSWTENKEDPKLAVNYTYPKNKELSVIVWNDMELNNISNI